MTETTKPIGQPRVVTFQIKVTVPPGMGDGKARRLLNKMLDVGYADAIESTDGDHGLDDGGDAQAAVSMNFDQPRLAKPNEIIVVIEGGCCTAVFSEDPNVKVELLDWDNAKDGDATPAERRAAMKLERRTEQMTAVL
jgi:hypothetical protein